MIRLAILALLLLGNSLAAAPRVHVIVWFDTEDYVLPGSDDSTLRLAEGLSKMGIRATFKVVGELARVLEQRGRKDVIRALSLHDIGYHSENHSFPPAPAVYLRDLGWLDGAAEFERREGRGVRDIQRIFGVTPSCYGQPGSSWGPQSTRALKRMGIPAYVDEGSQVKLDGQPFWFGGLLHVFAMGPNVLRASLDNEEALPETLRKFDEAAENLRQRGGGLISIYYHPNEFNTTEFWDGVNFARGALRERSEWRMPAQRTPESSERAHRIFEKLMRHIQAAPGAGFVTARDLTQIYRGPVVTKLPQAPVLAAHLKERLTFFPSESDPVSAAEAFLALLGLAPREVEGPSFRGVTTYTAAEISPVAFLRAQQDAISFINTEGRLPAEIWLGSEKLSLADFAATLAAARGTPGPIQVRRGVLEMENYIATDPVKSFNWVIHPEGFSAPKLLDMGRLQAWTLKPAVLR